MLINGWNIDTEEYRKAFEKAYGAPRNVIPEPAYVIHALEHLKPQDVKVVLLGQDPYHSRDVAGTDKAWGLSFGYNPKWQGTPNSSMKNIISELYDCGYKLEDLSLLDWAKQGVLLLNTQLTVELDKPLLHNGVWNKIVAQILNQVPEDAVGLAWGSPAKSKLGKHLKYVHFTSHPMKTTARTGRNPFLGSKCFLNVNNTLEVLGKFSIAWGSRK